MKQRQSPRGTVQDRGRYMQKSCINSSCRRSRPLEPRDEIGRLMMAVPIITTHDVRLRPIHAESRARCERKREGKGGRGQERSGFFFQTG
jgi:hypothetical protein